MPDPVIAQRTPYGVDVEADRTYYWYACGKSAKQPLCDGSHKGSEFTPMAWTAPDTKKVFFCGCKHSVGQPMCDGSHAKI